MKKRVIIFAFFLFILLLISFSFVSAELVAHYPFNSNTLLEDATGKYNGVCSPVSRCPSLANSGIDSRSYHFDGSNDIISLGDITEIDGSNKLSVSYWIKPRKDSARQMIISKWSSGGFWAELDDNKIKTVLSSGKFIVAEQTLNLGTWYHVAHIYDGTASTNEEKLKVYINGIKQTLTFPSGYTVPTIIKNTGHTTKANVGRYGGYYAFKGNLDEIRIYNNVLDDLTRIYGDATDVSDVEMIYNPDLSRLVDTGLIAYYPFDSNNQDYSGNNRHGQCGNDCECPTFVPAHINNGARFDGDDCVGVTNDIDEIDGTKEMTLDYYLQKEASAGAIITEWIRWFRDPCNMAAQQDTSFRSQSKSDGKMCFWFNMADDYDTSPPYACTTQTLNLNELYRVVQVFNGSGITNEEKFKTYINGIQETMTFHAGNVPSKIRGSSQLVVIGAYYDTGNSPNCVYYPVAYYKGIIDELKIYDRALSENEINPPTPPICGGLNQPCCSPPTGCQLGLVCTNGICQPQQPPEHRCSDNSQIILRLNGVNDAVAEAWNGPGNYQFEICYDEIFRVEYTNANPHNCVSGNLPANKVVGLLYTAGNTGGLAEIPSLNTYTAKICYGDLECTNRNSCNADEREVVSLSANTDAHLANDGSYPIKICCKSASASQSTITEADWTNMVNEEIATADLNDRVKLKIEGNNLNGKEIEYTIEQEKINWWLFKRWTQRTLISSVGETTWQANESGKFRFKAKAIDGSTNEKTSGELIVSNIINNSAPVAIITSPEDTENYFKTEIINYEQESYDEDDYFNYTWDFGDGTNVKGNSITYLNYNTAHQYLDGGQKYIFLNLIDERGARAHDGVSILIKDGYGVYVFADISNPLPGEAFATNTIKFNATRSFAEEYTSTGLFCIAGTCPATAHDGTIIQNTPNLLGFDNLAFNWTFADLTTNKAKGMSGAFFTRQMLVNGRQLAKLNVSFDRESSERIIGFIISQYPYCENSGTSWTLADGSQISSLNDCLKNPGFPSQVCCPVNLPNCNLVGSNHICQATTPPNPITACGSYTPQGEDECNNRFNTEIANADVEANILIPGGWQAGACSVNRDKPIGIDCREYVNSCFCKWDTNTRNCTAAVNVSQICPSTPTSSSVNGICNLVNAIAGECSNELRTLEMRYKWDSSSVPPLSTPLWCINKTSEFPCLSEALIPFFSYLNFLAAIAIIIAVYLLIRRKNKKKEKANIKKAKRKR